MVNNGAKSRLQLCFTTGRTEPIPLVMKEDTLCLGRLASEVQYSVFCIFFLPSDIVTEGY